MPTDKTSMELRGVKVDRDMTTFKLSDGRSIEFDGFPTEGTLAFKLADHLFTMNRTWLDAETIEKLVAAGGRLKEAA